MTIYKVSAASNNEREGDLVFSEELNIGENACHFNDNPAKNWQPVAFEWCTESHLKNQLIINDFVLVTGAGVFIALNDKAKNIIEPLLGNDVEFLEISITGEATGSWYLLNVIHHIDNAICEESSIYRTRRDGSRGRIKKVVFNDQNIPDNRVFVFPESPSKMMVKGDFLEKAVRENGLTGLNFTPWQVSSTTVAEAI